VSEPDVTLVDLRILLERVAGDVRTILIRLDQSEARQDDHEVRIRQVENTGCPLGLASRQASSVVTSSLEKRVGDLERWRWGVPSLTAIVAVLSLIAAVYGLLH
jgi:hypothetical protein